VPLIDVAGQQVHVIDRGEGPPLVFLHAFPLHAAMWDYQLEAFEATHRCLAVDMPGFGGSPAAADPASSTVEGWSDLVVGVLDQLNVEAASFVASSMGGYLAMAILRRHPQRVERVVFAGTRPRSDDSATADRRWEQLAQLRGGADIEPMAKGLVESLLSSGSLARDDLVAYVRALAEGVVREGWIGALEAMRKRPDSMLALRQSEVPALVVVGELDRITPIADATLIRSLLGEAELAVVPAVGHLPSIEDPLSFNEVVARFLGVELPDAGAAAQEPVDVPAVDAPGPDATDTPGTE
jgi:pimeloyl-ACP methyl ester carboxylesterase